MIPADRHQASWRRSRAAPGSWPSVPAPLRVRGRPAQSRCRSGSGGCAAILAPPGPARRCPVYEEFAVEALLLRNMRRRRRHGVVFALHHDQRRQSCASGTHLAGGVHFQHPRSVLLHDFARGKCPHDGADVALFPPRPAIQAYQHCRTAWRFMEKRAISSSSVKVRAGAAGRRRCLLFQGCHRGLRGVGGLCLQASGDGVHVCGRLLSRPRWSAYFETVAWHRLRFATAYIESAYFFGTETCVTPARRSRSQRPTGLRHGLQEQLAVAAVGGGPRWAFRAARRSASSTSSAISDWPPTGCGRHFARKPAAANAIWA